MKNKIKVEYDYMDSLENESFQENIFNSEEDLAKWLLDEKYVVTIIGCGYVDCNGDYI